MEMTRKERRELNRARHERERAKLERKWAAEAEAKREEKRRRREQNRAAWWAMRYGVVAPHGSEPDVMPACSASSIEEADAGEWHVIGEDGRGYLVERKYTVTLDDGSAYDVPAIGDAGELIALAVATNVEESAGAASFAAGQSIDSGSVTYRVAHVTSRSVRLTIETTHGDRDVTLKLRHSARGQWVRLYANSKAQRDIYAADMAA